MTLWGYLVKTNANKILVAVDAVLEGRQFISAALSDASAVESCGRVQSVTSKRQLRQFQIESVKFVGTQVTDEESGAVGGNVAPGASRTTPESVKAFKSTRSSERVCRPGSVEKRDAR